LKILRNEPKIKTCSDFCETVCLFTAEVLAIAAEW